MSVIGFKDILVCSLVSDVQNVSWIQTHVSSTDPAHFFWLCLRADGISVWTVSVSVWRDSWLQAFPSDSLPLPFLSISLSLSLSWQQDFLSVPGHRAPHFRCACDRGVSQHPPIPPCSACLISLCVVCVCLSVFHSPSAFPLPLVLLTCLSFPEKLISS